MANILTKYDRHFQFGKYQGKSVSEVSLRDPQYIEYLHSQNERLFTPFEIQNVRNVRNRIKNKDVHVGYDSNRTKIENEMYSIFKQIAKK